MTVHGPNGGSGPNTGEGISQQPADRTAQGDGVEVRPASAGVGVDPMEAASVIQVPMQGGPFGGVWVRPRGSHTDAYLDLQDFLFNFRVPTNPTFHDVLDVLLHQQDFPNFQRALQLAR